MGRHANPDIRRAFTEFNDNDTPTKCAKVRCLHCGYTRAKNTTRQIEHLQECQPYLNSPEAVAYVQATQAEAAAMHPEATRSMLNGTHPNPNLQIHRRGPNNKRPRDSLPGQSPITSRPPPPQPSLTSHLLSTNHTLFGAATQQPFLSHAGCGTLSASALAQWMVQDGHYTRGYIQFIGALISKIRLPSVPNSQFNPMFRTLDLLISALNNIRREMSFFDITATKYAIQLNSDPPNFVTRAYLDLFIAVSSPAASLLEGMVVLWATEHWYRSAWLYAQSFSSTLSGPSSESHIAALHQSLIPNWTSPAFSKFVDACRGLVDELANSPTISNGKEEMERCNQVFRQVCWLAERFWPDVDGMGEEDENGRLGLSVNSAQNGEGSTFGGGTLNGVSEAASGTAA